MRHLYAPADVVRGLTPAERIELALRMGDEEAKRLATQHGCSIQEARDLIRERNAEGRRRLRRVESSQS